MEERKLNIVEICKADKDNLLQSLKNKEIKEQTTGVDSKTEWMDLPKLYMDYINQFAKDILEYDKECKLNWFKFKYPKQELWGKRLGLPENNENNNIEKKMTEMYTKKSLKTKLKHSSIN